MSSKPLAAASVWATRSSLKPHFRDGLDASADSDYYVVVISLRALFNKAGLAAHFIASGDVADLQLKVSPFDPPTATTLHRQASWIQDRTHLEALLIGVLQEFLASGNDSRLSGLLTGVVTWAAATDALETKINAVKKTSVDLRCVRRRRAALALMRCASRCCRLWRGGGCYAPELTAHAWLGGMM